MSAPAFTVEAALTPDELRRAAALGQRDLAPVPRADALAATAAGMVVAIGGAATCVAGGLIAADGAWAVAMSLLVAFIAGLLVMGAVIARRYRRAMRAVQEAPLAREPRRYLIGDDGLVVLGATADAHWRWPAFTSADITDGLLVLQADVSRAVSIPTRAFRDEAEAQATLAYARARIA